MNVYLEKVAKMVDGRRLVSAGRDFIHGGLDEISAMKATRAVALKALKSVPKHKMDVRQRLLSGYKAIYKDHLGTGQLDNMLVRASGI